MATPTQSRKVVQTWSFRGSKSRNKVSVGEPAEGSLLRCNGALFSCCNVESVLASEVCARFTCSSNLVITVSYPSTCALFVGVFIRLAFKSKDFVSWHNRTSMSLQTIEVCLECHFTGTSLTL